MHPKHWIPLALAAVLLTACGGDDDAAGPPAAGSAGTSGVPATSTPNETDGSDTAAGVAGPCDLTEPEVVASIFGGTADAEQPGVARNCTYLLQGGTADQVEVYYYGQASEWDGVRQGYADNRGPLTDVPDVGDEAFYPGDVGDYELVVRAGDVIFAVGFGSLRAPDDYADRLRALAVQIATDLG